MAPKRFTAALLLALAALLQLADAKRIGSRQRGGHHRAVCTSELCGKQRLPAATGAEATATEDTFNKETRISTVRQCTAEEARWQQQKFNKMRASDGGWNACGTKGWLTKYDELAPIGDRVVFDIGCNKGYESGLFFELLRPEAKVGPTNLFNIHKKEGLPLHGSMCGTCNNCNEKVERKTSDSKRHAEVHVYCFEPGLGNFGALLTAHKQLGPQLAEQNVFWHLANSAMGNRTGLIRFPRDCGSTLCSLHMNRVVMPDQEEAAKLNKEHGSYGAAFISTVDDYFNTEQLAGIDILKIDTEGNDPAVMLGAMKTFAARRIGLLYFEYHSIGLWAQQYSLREMTQQLGGHGYVCYFEGSPTLARITGCWVDEYEFRAWSNVVCVLDDHWILPAMEEMTFLARRSSSS